MPEGPSRAWRALRRGFALLGFAGALGAAADLGAIPRLVDPSAGQLDLVTPDPAQQAKLLRIDGLAFDARGNLLGVLEIPDARGGVVAIDPQTGNVDVLVTGILRADQIALHPDSSLYVTSEVIPPATTGRLFRVTVGYDAAGRPLAGATSATSVTTSLTIVNPEGLAVLDRDGAFGNAGDLLVAEDTSPGRILRVQPATGTTSVLTGGRARPEGLAWGDFGGQSMPAVFVAETLLHRVLRIESTGAATVVGPPAAVGMLSPDNVEFGPGGNLWVSEDRPAPASRLIRIAADGTHEVVATGFGQAQGLVFDPASGDLYVAEQDSSRIWRLRFPTATQRRDWSAVKRAFR